MRDSSVFQLFQNLIDQVPLSKRHKLTLEFDLIQKHTAHNVEIMYRISTQRLAQLSYSHEWARTLNNSAILKPHCHNKYAPDYIRSSFHDLEAISEKTTESLNGAFSSWIMNNILRDCNEFLMYYLLGVFETCLIAKNHEGSLKPEDVVNGRIKSQKFEKNGLADRLKILRKDFDIAPTYCHELIGLYKLRNIFAHFDGIIQQDDCQKDGTLKVLWPTNTYKFRKTGTNEWIPYRKVRKPFSAEQYDKVTIHWFNKRETKIYQAGERITLSEKELNDLLSFYLFVFNEIQKDFVTFMKKQNLKVKDFQKYICEPSFMGVDENNKSTDFNLMNSSK